MKDATAVVRSVYPCALARYHSQERIWAVVSLDPDAPRKPGELLRFLGTGVQRRHAWDDAAAAVAHLRRCRVCSCTEAQGCPEGCWWVGPDLCSSCGGPPEAQLTRSALLSPCGRYRYRLERRWARAGERQSLVLMLSPSKADAKRDDPTVRRLTLWHWQWGFGGFAVGNLLPIRSSQPQEARAWFAAGRHEDPMRTNLQAIQHAAKDARMVLVAWGAVPGLAELKAETLAAVRAVTDAPMYCLGLSPGGEPLHPMARGRYRVPDNATPIPFSPGS